MKPRHPVNVEVTRGPIVENRHQVIYVVTDNRGLLVDYHGNTDYVVTPRSSVKWLQAVPFVESGALEKWGLGEMHIALACASHKAQEHHLSLLKKWMEAIGVTEKDLECGPAGPTNSSLSHNCSGKHLGFISTAKMKSWEISKYTDYSHPIQVLQKKWMTQ
ncbi:MAG: asparaginase, partial [Bdellovibrionales bacterium]